MHFVSTNGRNRQEPPVPTLYEWAPAIRPSTSLQASNTSALREICSRLSLPGFFSFYRTPCRSIRICLTHSDSLVSSTTNQNMTCEIVGVFNKTWCSSSIATLRDDHRDLVKRRLSIVMNRATTIMQCVLDTSSVIRTTASRIKEQWTYD